MVRSRRDSNEEPGEGQVQEPSAADLQVERLRYLRRQYEKLEPAPRRRLFKLRKVPQRQYRAVSDFEAR